MPALEAASRLDAIRLRRERGAPGGPAPVGVDPLASGPGREERADAMPVGIEGDAGAAKSRLVGACTIRNPRSTQSAWIASSAAASRTVKAISPPPAPAAAVGSTVRRDHRPSIT